MKRETRNTERIHEVWRGQTNSKRQPLRLFVQTYGLTPTNTDPFIFKGTVLEEAPASTRLLARPNEHADTYVVCIREDVSLESGEAIIKENNTGGYKNTGCHAIIVCLPGTVLRIWGYDRRTHYLAELTTTGQLKEIDGVAFVDKENSPATWADLWPK